jgi:WD40 repeat protein
MANNTKYHKTLASYFQSKPLYLDEYTQKKPNTRKLVEQPWQQTKAKMWDEATNTVCNLEFIQAKAAAEKAYELIREFNEILERIPYNQISTLKSRRRQDILDKYARYLLDCAGGKLNLIDIPVPCSIENLDDQHNEIEIEGIKSDLNHADRLNAYLGFLGCEVFNLQRCSKEIQFFTHQQAWNFSLDGPVGNDADNISREIRKKLILRNHNTRKHWISNPPLLRILQGHTSRVYTVALSPDGKMALSGSRDKTCILWDLSTGKASRILTGHSAEVLSVAISADSKFALSGSNDGTCIYWNLNSGKPLRTILRQDEWVHAVAMTPDGRLGITGSENKKVVLWDLKTGDALLTLSHEEGVKVVAISPDGRMALSASVLKSTCIHWDLTSGKAICTNNEIMGVQTIVPSFDWKRAFIGTRSAIYIWDLQTGIVQKKNTGTLNYHSFDITTDGRLAFFGSYHNDCDLWDLSSWKLVKSFQSHAFEINAVAILSDGSKAISASSDNTCILWDLTSSNNFEKHNSIPDHRNRPGPLQDVTTIPRENLALSASLFGERVFWDVTTGQVISKIKGCFDDSRILITPDKKLIISGTSVGQCVLYNLKDGNEIKRLISHTIGRIDAFTLTPDGRYAISSARDNDCITYDLAMQSVLRLLYHHTSEIRAIALSPDGQVVLIGSVDKICLLIEFNTGNVIKKLVGHKNPISSVVFSPDGKLAFSGSFDGSCILWDLVSGKPIFNLFGHSEVVKCVRMFSDGQKAISCSFDNSLIIWDLSTGRIISKVILDSSIWAFEICSNTLVVACVSGVNFLNLDLNQLIKGIPITSIRQYWNFELNRYSDPMAYCSWCSNDFIPSPESIQTIIIILNDAGLSHKDTPCLKLPNDAWENPRLECECPSCHGTIKFNPFFGSDQKGIEEYITVNKSIFERANDKAQLIADNLEERLE